ESEIPRPRNPLLRFNLLESCSNALGSGPTPDRGSLSRLYEPPNSRTTKALRRGSTSALRRSRAAVAYRDPSTPTALAIQRAAPTVSLTNRRARADRIRCRIETRARRSSDISSRHAVPRADNGGTYARRACARIL